MYEYTGMGSFIEDPSSDLIGDWEEPLRIETLTNRIAPPPAGSLADAFDDVTGPNIEAEEARIEAENIARGTAPPAELDPAYEIVAGSDAEPAGIQASIESGRAGDLVASIGLPRETATVAIFFAAVFAVIASIKFAEGS